MAQELEDIESAASSLRLQVHDDIQALGTMFHSQLSMCEERAKDMCGALEARTKEMCKGIGNAAEKLRMQEHSVESKRCEFHAERQALQSGGRIGPQVILNVGGHKFHTTTATLCNVQGSMLEAMFSGRHSAHTEQDGSYFIDRDGTHFRHILNYLRDGRISTQLCSQDAMEVACEAMFYGLKDLHESLVGIMVTQHLPEEVSQMRLEETQMRKFFLSGAADHELSRFKGLISVFDTPGVLESLTDASNASAKNPNVLLNKWQPDTRKPGEPNHG